MLRILHQYLVQIIPLISTASTNYLKYLKKIITAKPASCQAIKKQIEINNNDNNNNNDKSNNHNNDINNNSDNNNDNDNNSNNN